MSGNNSTSHIAMQAARHRKFAPIFAACWLLIGCSMTPSTRIQQPLTAIPADRQVVTPADGSIFRAGANERPMFEDKRARNIGDILIITIAEKTTGKRATSGSATSASSINAGTPNITGPGGTPVMNVFSVTGDNSSKSSITGAGAANQDLTGTITVTVVEVLANGNLLVGGEKQLALNNSDEFIRFSGVVNPTTITGANTVPSTQVADVHIEYKNAGAMSEVINDSKSLGFLGRFFQSVMPF
ncbi:MAG: flagellar basal body L-ring protein FlgH [Gallionella sp.]